MKKYYFTTMLINKNNDLDVNTEEATECKTLEEAQELLNNYKVDAVDVEELKKHHNNFIGVYLEVVVLDTDKDTSENPTKEAKAIYFDEVLRG